MKKVIKLHGVVYSVLDYIIAAFACGIRVQYRIDRKQCSIYTLHMCGFIRYQIDLDVNTSDKIQYIFCFESIFL